MRLTAAVAETIRYAGPGGAIEGLLYSAVSDTITLDGWHRLVGLLAKAGLVKREYDRLYWVGPVEAVS